MTSPVNPADRDKALIRAAQAQAEGILASRLAADTILPGRPAGLGGGEAAGRTGDLHNASLAGYEILGELHRGGQGVVYEAIQRATKRHVAVKVLHGGGRIGSGDRRRFQREIEILSQLRHPNVVTVYDSGEAAGRFYYVMDLVRGVPLDRWIERQRSNVIDSGAPRVRMREFVREVLRLFIRVCDAVNAAHLRGVIHRDLKPGNILVDGSGEPRVLDFGLAKFAEGVPEDSSALETMTQTGQFVGSLPWSSPEQAGGGGHEVDVRTDVYALGILLYQALTGRFPYRVSGRISEIVSEICNAAPRPLNESPLPASPGSDSGRKAARTAVPRFDTDLETIVQRCLAKERERRYQSAGDLGRDLERYQNGEPIEARRDSVGYVLRKQLRRYRLQLAITSSFLLVLTTGLVTSLAAWNSAERHSRRAETQRRESEAVAELLRSLLLAANPLESKRPDMTVREMLDRFDERLGGSFADQPAAEARLREIIGQSYTTLGIYDKAAWHLRRSLELRKVAPGENSPQYGLSLVSLGYMEKDLSNYTEALDLFQRGEAVLSRHYPAEDYRVIHTRAGRATVLRMLGRYQEARALFEENLRHAEALAEKHRWLIGSNLHGLAAVVEPTDGPAAAEPLLRESLANYRETLGEDHPETATVLMDLADTLRQQERYAEARDQIAEARRVFAAAYGDAPHPRMGHVLTAEALIHRALREYEAAERAGRASLALRRRLFPGPHRETASSLNNLGSLLMDMRRYEESVGLLLEALDMTDALVPDVDPNIGTIWNNLGRAYFFAGRLREAEEALREALRQDEQYHPPYSDAVIEDLKGLSFALDAQGDLVGAIEIWREMIARRMRAPNPPGDKLRENRLRLAELLNKQARQRIDGGAAVEAESAAAEAIQIRRELYGAADWRTHSSTGLLGEALLAQGRFEEAETHLLESLRGMRAAGDAPAVRLQGVAAALVRLYESRGDDESAAQWREELQRISQPAQ